MATELAATLLWQRLDVTGLEHCRLGTDAAGPRLPGPSSPRTTARRLELVTAERHRWWAVGTELVGVAGCVLHQGRQAPLLPQLRPGRLLLRALVGEGAGGSIHGALRVREDGKGEVRRGGIGRLFINGKKVAEAQIPKTIPFRYSLDETFEVANATPAL